MSGMTAGLRTTGWQFRAHTAEGRVHSGIIQATTADEAHRALVKQKLIPDQIRSEPEHRTFRIRRRPDARALVHFTRQWATLMESAVPLILSLEILRGLTEDRPLRRAIAKVTENVEAGTTIAGALRFHPAVFSDLFVSMVEAGEEGGTLDTSLNRLADHLERSKEVKDRLQGAMVYPLVILMVALSAVVAMLVFVVPTFEGMFATSGVALPYATQLLMDSSEGLMARWPAITISLLAAGVLLKGFRDTSVGRLWTDRVILVLPIVGPLARKSAVARFARTLSSLLHSGVAILDATIAAARTSGNAVIETGVIRSRNAIAQGEGVSEALAASRVLPKLLARMVSVGEQTGRLDEMLAKVARFYEKEVDAEVEGLMRAVEPILVVMVGLLLGVLVVTLYLPIFDSIGAVDPSF